MILFYDARCLDYGSSMRPEQPARLGRTVPHLRATFPEWLWREAVPATDAEVRRAHEEEHLRRLAVARDFDDDTPYFEGIGDHARRAAGAAVAASRAAWSGEGRAIALMRPPGHHATVDQAMGFCYLNGIAIAALAAQAEGVGRVAVWDFDAHHGNGTEAILLDRPGMLFASVHQSPGYPGTGLVDRGTNCRNWPVPPRTPRAVHREVLRASWEAVVAFAPDLVLVSAGFDAYAQDPITAMTLEMDDFAELGVWLHAAPCPVAAVLEGGYSGELPRLVEAFLGAWEGEKGPA